MMDYEAIAALLPHRYPFLMLDRVVELEPHKRAVGIKQVTNTEFWATGHFPGNPVMPGVLIIEAMAQLAAVHAMVSLPEIAGKTLYLASIDRVKFRRPVRPGDTLRLEAESGELRRRMWSYVVRATVDGKRVAEGQMLAALPADPGSEEAEPRG